MALSKETITKLASLVGVSFDDFKAKIESEEEQSLDVPRLYTEEEKDTFGSNRFNEGKQAMKEIQVKDLREKYPVSYSGKDLDKYMESYKQAVLEEAEVNPDKKVEELQKEMENLRNKYQDDMATKEDEIKKLQGSNYRLSTTQRLVSLLKDDTVIPKDDIVTLYLTKHELERGEDGTLIKKDGKVLKDELQNPIKLEEHFVSWVDDNKYVGKVGMGGDDKGNGSGEVKEFEKMSDFEAYCQENDIEMNSDEAQKLFEEKKVKEGFDYNG